MLRMADAPALVVGGGQVAANKVRLLLGAGAQVHVVSATLCAELRQLADEGAITHKATHARPEDAATLLAPRYRLAYLATDDRGLNSALATLCQDHGIPVCAVDDPEISSFITPAIVSRGAVQIAVSTGGAAPVLARRLRARIEEIMPAGLGRLAAFMQAQRHWLREKLPDPAERRQLWERFLDGMGGHLARQGQTQQARQELDSLLANHTQRGEVWLVGAGPGDPDLLTLAALRLMQDADAVLYDNLVAPGILDYVRRDAERIFVGKSRNKHTLPQEGINAELVRRAQAGQRVLRLKGGDPFIFGRGGEEMETLAASGVPFRIVPGISAANGCASYAGIPLTHRDCAQSCLFMTGHAKADGSITLDWDAVARHNQTVVIYMGLSTLPHICARLTAHGLPPDWPAALVERGTTPDQRVITGTLETLPDLAIQQKASSPALLIIGQVINHRVSHTLLHYRLLVL